MWPANTVSHFVHSFVDSLSRLEDLDSFNVDGSAQRDLIKRDRQK